MKLRLKKAGTSSEATGNASVVSGGVSANKSSKKAVFYIVIAVLLVLGVGSAYVYMNKNNVSNTDEGANPNKELTVNEAKGAIEQQIKENGGGQNTDQSQQAPGGQGEQINTAGLPAAETMNYEASLETASNLAQAGASTDTVMAYYKRALSLGGDQNYAINLNIALYLKDTSAKKDAVPYINKAIELLPSAGLDPDTLGEQRSYLEQILQEVQA